MSASPRRVAAGRHAEVVPRLTDLAREHPLRERFSAQLITALYRCGRQVDALRTYAQVRESLLDEFGVDPGQELRDLEQAVLAHDPSLAAPPSAMQATTTRLADQPAGDPFHQTPDRLPLLGREREVTVLRADLDDALLGRGRLALLVGEPGIGKTRLAEELASEAEIRGATIGWGRNHDDGGAIAFWSWIQVVRTLLERAPREVVVAALGRRAAEIAQVVPEVHDLVPDLDPPPALDPDGAPSGSATPHHLLPAWPASDRCSSRRRVQWAARRAPVPSFCPGRFNDARLLGGSPTAAWGTGLRPAGPDPRVQRGANRSPVLVVSPAATARRSALWCGVRGEPSDESTTVHRRTQGTPSSRRDLRLLPSGRPRRRRRGLLPASVARSSSTAAPAPDTDDRTAKTAPCSTRHTTSARSRVGGAPAASPGLSNRPDAGSFVEERPMGGSVLAAWSARRSTATSRLPAGPAHLGWRRRSKELRRPRDAPEYRPRNTVRAAAAGGNRRRRGDPAAWWPSPSGPRPSPPQLHLALSCSQRWRRSRRAVLELRSVPVERPPIGPSASVAKVAVTSAACARFAGHRRPRCGPVRGGCPLLLHPCS